MDDGHLHGDADLVRHLLSRMSPVQRREVLATAPEYVALLKARRMLWLRIGMCGNEGSADDVLDLYCSEDP
jgi:hypothetical protein